MPDYEYDIFISYRHADDDWIRWTRENFVRPLRTLMRPALGGVRIFMDESIETGTAWPSRLAKSLARSRLMIPVLSRDYFQSHWCRLELALMLHRQQQLQLRTPSQEFGLIIPVVIDDGDCFPLDVKEMQAEPFHEFANPFIRIDSPKQERFAENLRTRLCPTIEATLPKVPQFDVAWEQTAHEQFANLFRIQAQPQVSLPGLSLPSLK
jgi:hypothetical protein